MCEQAIEMCAATTGFSVGEYASLVFAGAISFEEGNLLFLALLGGIV